MLFISLTLFAQHPEGAYINGEDSIVFSGDNVVFRISGFTGLTSAQAGEGKYEIIDDFLIIHTSEYSGDKSSYEKVDGTKRDTCVVVVNGVSGYPVQGVLVESRNKSNKVTGAQVTGNNGQVMLLNLEKTTAISVTSMGYNSIRFDYEPGRDYNVTIAANDIIENKTVVFKINRINDDSVTLLLLSDDFNAGKDIEKGLSRLDKRARRGNIIPKLYTKEETSFRR